MSNSRAEVAVKAAKRLFLENTGPFGSLNTDHFLRRMLQLRNNPDPDCHISPAQIVLEEHCVTHSFLSVVWRSLKIPIFSLLGGKLGITKKKLFACVFTTQQKNEMHMHISNLY